MSFRSVLSDASAAAALVRAAPFVHLPLHLRCFSNKTFDITSALVRFRDPDVRLSCVTEKANYRLAEQITQFPPADPSLDLTLDLEGLSNSTTPSEETGEAFLDLSDAQFRTGDTVVGKWSLLREAETFLRCNLCTQPISDEVRGQSEQDLPSRTTSRSRSALPRCRKWAILASTSLT